MVSEEHKAPPIHIIEWTDSFSIEDEWYNVGESHDPRNILTCGYVVGEDDKYVYIATTFDTGSGMYSVGIGIYKPCITSRTVLATAGYR
jgi:hypothetical protein